MGGVIDLSGLGTLLAGLAGNVTDLRPAFFRIDADVSERLREQFATRGAALGTPWKPISPVTVRLRIEKRMVSARARKRAMGAAGADMPLQDSREMWASFTKPVGPNALRVVDALEYQRGSRYAPNGVPVAVLMQNGFNSTYRPVFGKHGAFFIKRKSPVAVPARPIIPSTIPAPVLKAWEGYITQYLTQGTL